MKAPSVQQNPVEMCHIAYLQLKRSLAAFVCRHELKPWDSHGRTLKSPKQFAKLKSTTETQTMAVQSHYSAPWQRSSISSGRIVTSSCYVDAVLIGGGRIVRIDRRKLGQAEEKT